MAQTWYEAVGTEKEKAYLQTILEKARYGRQAGITVYPSERDIFNAFRMTEFGSVKVVTLGQDPYYGTNQVHGLAFSVQPEIAVPPPLVNIYRGLATDVEGLQISQHGYLQHQAEQGVLLPSTALTVHAGVARSHATLGWKIFAGEAIRQLDKEREYLVFMLWGSHAQKRGTFIDRNHHLVLVVPHPSPLSVHRGFFGCKYSSQTNAYLQTNGLEPID